jgi:hypothetical protein
LKYFKWNINSFILNHIYFDLKQIQINRRFLNFLILMILKINLFAFIRKKQYYLFFSLLNQIHLSYLFFTFNYDLKLDILKIIFVYLTLLCFSILFIQSLSIQLLFIIHNMIIRLYVDWDGCKILLNSLNIILSRLVIIVLQLTLSLVRIKFLICIKLSIGSMFFR